jgi:hypothetical protein
MTPHIFPGTYFDKGGNPELRIISKYDIDVYSFRDDQV